MSTEKEYINELILILNKIKKRLLINTANTGIIDYLFNINVKWRADHGLLNERALLQKLINEGLVSEVGEVDIFEKGEPGTMKYEAYEVLHFKVSNKFDDYYDKYQKTQIAMDNYCWFDNNTFFLSLKDNSVKAISFDTERGSRQVLALFQAIIEHWKNKGSEPISGSKVIALMTKYGSSVDAIQLKNIFANVRNKKIKPAGLEDKIHIKYDRNSDGWRIDIKR